jgi:hypothetical protein
MKVEIDAEDIKVRSVDSSGRVSIGRGEYAGKTVEVAVLGVKDEDEVDA